MAKILTLSWAIPWCVLLGLLVAISMSDLHTRTIPNALSAAVLLLSFVVQLLHLPFPDADISVLGRILGVLLCAAPFIVAAAAGSTIGGGDMKLMAAAGYALGLHYGLLALCLGSLFGAVWALWLRCGRAYQPHDSFAYGPFLSAGIALAPLVGQLVFG